MKPDDIADLITDDPDVPNRRYVLMTPKEILENLDKKKLEKLTVKNLIELIGEPVTAIGIRSNQPAVIEGVQITKRGVLFMLREEKSGNKVLRKSKKFFIREGAPKKRSQKSPKKIETAACSSCHTKNLLSDSKCRHCHKLLHPNEAAVPVFDLSDLSTEASDGRDGSSPSQTS